MLTSHRVGLVKWNDSDGINDAIKRELTQLGHEIVCFRFDQPVPRDVDIVFTFAPYGRLQQIPHQLAQLPSSQRPIYIHWNTENYPDPRIPWPIVNSLAAFRSWVDRLHNGKSSWSQRLVGIPPLAWIDKGMTRFRLIGDYRYLYHSGKLDLLFESSQVYTQRHHQHGLPAIYVPWGTVPEWYEDRQLERDIDVFWMGKRRTKRRSEMIDEIYEKLTPRGYNVYVADNEMKPFVYGDQRTEMLNRAKITLNLESEWHDNALPYRFHIAAANRSMIISETLLPHYSSCQVGKHYASADPPNLAETVLYYLEHEDKRQEIVDNAYQLMTTELTLRHSIEIVLEAVDKLQQERSSSSIKDYESTSRYAI